MTVAVFGCGFVGTAVADWLEANTDRIVLRVDPKFDWYDPQEAVLHAQDVIVCVPTPSKPDGSCDDSIVQEVLELCDHRHRVLIKSTVTADLLDAYDPNVCYNPEFLRAAHAEEDFRTQEMLIIGHHDNNIDDAIHWSKLFNKLPAAPVFMNRKTASMVKYAHNAWLATKVAWFHELYNNLPPGVDYTHLTNTLGVMENIGPSHMGIWNSNLGYGGHCFPKDVEALTNYVNHSILEQVKKTNETLNETTIQRSIL